MTKNDPPVEYPPFVYSLLQPRNDWVLIEIVEVGETPSGIAIPQISVEGKEFYVRNVGPKVEDLVIGNRVLMIGRQGVDYFPLPRSSTLFMIQEKQVVLVDQRD
mgnify:CR=1 FL=1